MCKINVNNVELPDGIRGLVGFNGDDTYNIYMNMQLQEELRLKALLLEIANITGTEIECQGLPIRECIK